MTLYTYNPQLMSLPSINFLHLRLDEIYPGQHFQTQGYCGKVKRQIKVTPLRCTLTPPNQCPYQVLTSYTLRFLRYSPDKLFPADCPPAQTPLSTASVSWITSVNNFQFFIIISETG